MDAEEFFDKRYKKRIGLNDKFDMVSKQFDSYDMVSFAEQYHQHKQLLNNPYNQKRNNKTK